MLHDTVISRAPQSYCNLRSAIWYTYLPSSLSLFGYIPDPKSTDDPREMTKVSQTESEDAASWQAVKQTGLDSQLSRPSKS